MRKCLLFHKQECQKNAMFELNPNFQWLCISQNCYNLRRGIRTKRFELDLPTFVMPSYRGISAESSLPFSFQVSPEYGTNESVTFEMIPKRANFTMPQGSISDGKRAKGATASHRSICPRVHVCAQSKIVQVFGSVTKGSGLLFLAKLSASKVSLH